MDTRARHLTLAAATLVFVVVAGSTLGWANGWRWSDGRLVRSAGVFIETQPRATVLIDGQVVGSSPWRSATLLSRSVTLAVQRSGYLPWTQPLSLTPGQAISIATLYLFPAVQPVLTIQPTTETFFTDDRQHTLWSATPQADGQVLVRAFGLPGYVTPVAIPFVPTLISLAPDRTHVYFRNQTQAGILSNHRDWWMTNLVDGPRWSADGSDILFGISNGVLVRIDALARSITLDAAFSSIAIDSAGLWATRTDQDTTDVWRIDPTNFSRRKILFRLAGGWEFLSSPAQVVVLMSTDGQSSRLIHGNQATGWRMTDLGQVEQIVSASLSQPLTWVTGSDIFVRQGRRTSLVDRVGQGVVWAGWLHAPQALVVFDGHVATLYNQLQDRTWHRIASQPVGTQPRFLAGNTAGDGFWYQDGDQVFFWSWRS